MKLINDLEKIVKKLEGSLIGIGIDEKNIINEINNNDKIIECNLIGCLSIDDEMDGKIKKIRIGKIRKKFKKNKPDYIIYNIESLKDYKEKFVYDSIYLTNKKIYAYNLTEIELESFLRRYSRYSIIETKKYEDGSLYIITKNKKMGKISEKFNKLKDNIINCIDLISNLLS